MRVEVPSAALRALVTGEVVTLPHAPGIETGTTVTIVDAGGDAGPLKPAYRRWARMPVAGTWTATVTRLMDTESLDAGSFASRHVLGEHPTGMVAILRVSGDDGPVLSDTAFEARVRSVS